MANRLDETIVKAGDVETPVALQGSGPPLVYLHGAWGYQGWHPFMDRLAAAFTVYAPLHPGFGENGGLDGINDTLDLTLYHFDLLDALGLDAPPVVGHFLGGMIAAEMAALRPGSVGRLALAAPAGVWRDDAPGVDYFAVPMNELRGVLFADPECDAAKSLLPEPEDDMQRGTQIIERVRSLAAVGKFLWPIPDKGLIRRMPRITSPSLIVMGEKDQIVPASYADEFTSRIPGASAATIPDAGHMLMLERPDEFADAAIEFLQG